jgi:hypothetical protein
MDQKDNSHWRIPGKEMEVNLPAFREPDGPSWTAVPRSVFLPQVEGLSAGAPLRLLQTTPSEDLRTNCAGRTNSYEISCFSSVPGAE